MREKSKKLNILYLRTNLNRGTSSVGGSITHSVGVIQGFIKKEYIVFCASSVLPDVLSKLDVYEFKLLYVPPILFFLRTRFFAYLRWRLECLISNIIFPIQLISILRKNKFEFIYQRYSLLNCVGVILKKITKTPLILEYNGSEVWVFKAWAEKKQYFRLQWLSKKIEKLNLVHADLIIVVSSVLRDELMGRGISVEKIIVNPNGVNPDVFNPVDLSEQRISIRERLGFKNKFVFGFVGTFSYWHGIDVLAYTIPKVIFHNPNVHFILIGNGVLKEFLQNELRDRGMSPEQVSFLGEVAHDEVKNYLNACDAFLCPTQPNKDGSRFFGSPTKMFEYMSMAKPIIASDLEQLSELLNPAYKIQGSIVQDEVGILVNPNDFDGFVKTMCQLVIMGKDPLKKLGENARKRAIDFYSWDLHVAKIIDRSRFFKAKI